MLQQNQQQQYNPFNIPPSIPLSLLHRECSQFGCPDYLAESCPCCKQHKRSKLSVKCTLDEIYNVNEPVGIYFTYIKIMCFVLMVIMLVTGIYSLVKIIDECQNSTTNSCIYVYGIPITKIHAFFTLPLIIVNGFIVLFLYGVIGFMFFKITYLHQRNICHHEVPSDFCVLLSNVDHQKITNEHILRQLKDYEVKDILHTHKIKEYLKDLAEKSVCQRKKCLFYWKNMREKEDRESQKIKKIQNSLLHVKNAFILGQDVHLRTDKIIITFHSSIDKKKFQSLYKQGLFKTIRTAFCGGGNLIIEDIPLCVQPLGQPPQIIWQHLQITSKVRYFRIFLSNMVTLIVLGGTFFAIIKLTTDQKNNDKQGNIYLSFLFALLIQATNFILNITIEVLTQWEGRYTMTGQITSKLYKKCFAYFLNTTLIPFSLFLFSMFEPDEDDLIRNILTLFFVSNLISPIVGLYLQPSFLYKIYSRYKIRKDGQKSLQSQIRSNATFEKMNFMLDERYALVCQLFMNCLFYAAIFPVGILITIVGMTITFWSSKWWLVNNSSMPKFSFKIGKHINIISCYFPFIYAFGYATNLYMVKNEEDNFERQYSLFLAIATIPLTLLFIFFGQKLAKKWITTRRRSVIECMNKQKHQLTYRSLNPTSFLHPNLSEEISTKENMWEVLNSYINFKEANTLPISQISHKSN